jgi:hypothetical protein
MRWLKASEEFIRYATCDIDNRDKYIDYAFRSLKKHYENERVCNNCNMRYCKRDNFINIDACVDNNHKHWEADYEN